MDSDPASRAVHKHTNGWMTVLALCLLAVGLLACLYVLVGFPAEAQVTGSTDSITTPAPQPVRRQPLYAAQAALHRVRWSLHPAPRLPPVNLRPGFRLS